MKILLIHQFLASHDDPGGSRHLELLRFWNRGGHQIRAVAGSVNYMTNRSKLFFGKFWKTEKISDIPVTWIYAFPTLHLGIAGKILAYLSFLFFALPVVLKESPDVVLVTSPPPTVAILGWVMNRLKKIPWIFEIRDLWPGPAADLGVLSRGLLYKLLERLSGFLYKRATFAVTLTWGIEKYLKESGISPMRLRTIPNGVDEQFLFPPRRTFPELEALRAEKKFIAMYVGALGRANQVANVLRLAGRQNSDSPIHFVIVGDGTEKKSLQRFAEGKNLRNVRFLDSIPRQDVSSLLGCADAGIVILAKVPEFRHALPNKLFDYMASGIPVILALQEGDAWRILEKAKGGLRVDPDDLESFEKCLVHLAENPKEAKAMGERGKAYALEHFSRKDLAGQYLEILEKVAREG